MTGQREETESWVRLQRRAALIAILVLALIVAPFLIGLALLNWAIVFRGDDWSVNLQDPGVPEVAAGLAALIVLALLIRALVFWMLGLWPRYED